MHLIVLDANKDHMDKTVKTAAQTNASLAPMRVTVKNVKQVSTDKLVLLTVRKTA